MTSLKRKVRSGQIATLINADHPSSSLVASLGGLGIDALMIDCEQGSPSFTDVEEMTRAARACGIDAIVRVQSAEPWVLERYLMRDIDGVVVPRLDSARQAAQAVVDIEYCVPKTFADKAVIIQLESRDAVDDLEAFLAIDEIDSYFIGAVDLAKSMGYRGDYAEPEVMKVVEATVARIVEAGRSVGMLVKEHDVRHWCEQGVTLCYAHVNDYIRIGAREWRRTAGIDEAGERA